MAPNPYDVYLEMASAWQSRIPKGLQGMKPRILIELLKLAASGEGASQSEAASKLGLTQWGVSKISKKLASERWVTIRRSESNHRQKLMITTARAQTVMDALRSDLSSVLRAGPSTKRLSGTPRPIDAEAAQMQAGTYEPLFGGARQVLRTRL